ncbi:serine/threonine-protein kinase TOR [Iris pallida]|uniref:Serine/threonine-protein kinase TOR n=1 Tax=Iris pallida TaxID=29817 RepID=A0AAX6FGI5_IRIPA|nr:serine/threonine-protein kinase TOR [Iris pallida]KAJ6834584.1 serine/threonine-protein kinase TOR [Iris pallida]
MGGRAVVSDDEGEFLSLVIVYFFQFRVFFSPTFLRILQTILTRKSPSTPIIFSSTTGTDSKPIVYREGFALILS